MGRLGPLAAALLGLLLFAARYGPGALWPANVAWLINDDFSAHLLGWLHFRNAPFGLPLGAVPNLLHPQGTTVGFTDSIPLVAVALRPISALLPAHFQYIGPWLGLCAAMQGAVGAWFARRLGAGTLMQVSVGGFLVLAPVLLARMSMAHEALSAHFLIIFAIALCLVPLADARDARRLLPVGVAACATAAAVHPVLGTMVVAMFAAACLRVALDRVLPLRWPLLAAGGAGGAAMLLFGAFGYFGGRGSLALSGFGYFSTNLNAFYNPVGWRNESFSRFLGALPRGFGQYEASAIWAWARCWQSCWPWPRRRRPGVRRWGAGGAVADSGASSPLGAGGPGGGGPAGGRRPGPGRHLRAGPTLGR